MAHRDAVRGPVESAPRAGDESEISVGAGLPSSGELFAAYEARIRRYILSMVHDPDEADDLTQDVFLQAHRHLSSLRDPDAAVSWLYRIATRACYDRFRKWARQPRPQQLDEDGLAAAQSAPGDDAEASLSRMLEQAEMSACVRSYLDELPDDYRNAVLLHDLEGLTGVEIAEMVGASLATVKIRLHRARRKLEAALATHCTFSSDEQGVFVCEPKVYLSPPPGRPRGQDAQPGAARTKGG